LGGHQGADPGWEPSGVDREEAHLRFAQEAAIVQRVQHADIVAVLDTGEAAGQLWLAMELAPGCGLDRYAQPRMLLPARVVLETWRAGRFRTLAHAHAQGVVHRDIKPANVLVNLATQRSRSPTSAPRAC
jgi:serine/threonine protein kinase